ncbi:hypothetical protein [Atlantibacter hermannii]|uniref:hypothetical protein n=1 Tax=Atlantibacter hermannii TaxID=565 RepID=UPI00296F2E2A|nr:hypothetical protein [Atlantibacter hermannii]MDW4578761.1 hypothetical protein [Atlantibacter hermannii]
MENPKKSNATITVPHSLNRKLKTSVGGIDWLTDYEIVQLNDEQRLQRKQHLHAMPATLNELFERFLLPALECDFHYKDYDFWSGTWRIQWAYHKQNYRREAILNGVTQQQYAEVHKLPKRVMYSNLHKCGGAAIRVLFWVYHRRQLHQQKTLTVQEYITEYQLPQRTAYRQLSRRPMDAIWAEHFDKYYTGAWLRNCNVREYADFYDLNATTARQYLFNFPKGLFDPMLIKPWM